MNDYQKIEKAILYLSTHSAQHPSLDELAGSLDTSKFHLQRIFKKWAGISPKNFLRALALSRAKELLPSKSVFETSLDVGLSSSSRLHDLFIQFEAMTPGEYKNQGEGLLIRWGEFQSPLGPFALAATDRGICMLAFKTEESEETGLSLRKKWPQARFKHDPRTLETLADSVNSLIVGTPRKLPIPLHLGGTPFQLKVWQALLRIPEGQLATYQQVAKSLGLPRAHRAVGTAIGANPIGYLIPCHRVIRSTGVIGDYRWGSTRKTALICLEHSRSR